MPGAVGVVSYADARVSISALVCTSSPPGLLGCLRLLSPGISFMLMNLNTVHMKRFPDFQTQPEPFSPAVDSAYPADHLLMPLSHLPRAELLVLPTCSSPRPPTPTPPHRGYGSSILPTAQAKNFYSFSLPRPHPYTNTIGSAFKLIQHPTSPVRLHGPHLVHPSSPT